jgi:hypothetical protein
MISAFLDALGADGPSADRAGKTDLFGQLARCSFSDIAADSFLWRGEVSADNGATWRVVTEFTARRRPA